MTLSDLEKLFLEHDLATLSIVKSNNRTWQIGVRRGDSYTIEAAPTIEEALRKVLSEKPNDLFE